MFDLKGRRIVVTGGGAGIGAATARLARDAGADVAILDLETQDVEPANRIWTLDIRDADAVATAVDEAAQRLGGLDGLVNCAGVSGRNPLEANDPEAWRRILEINLMGTVTVGAAALPHLRRSNGASIVNIASGQGLRPTPGAGAYAASKQGVVALTRVWAMELGPEIRVNVVCPGPIRTAMVERAYSAKQQAAMTETYALRRFGEPHEVANAIGFLLSGAASFITGSTLVVDGGRCFH